MFMGFFKPLLKEAGLIDENNASDPMNAAIGLADTAMLAQFLQDGIEAVGGMRDGANFSAVLPQTAPAPEIAPTIQANIDMNPPTPSMKMS